MGAHDGLNRGINEWRMGESAQWLAWNSSV